MFQLRYFFTLILAFSISAVQGQIGFLQPRMDHLTGFSYLDFGGPSLIGESTWLTFSNDAPKNNATLVNINYSLGGFLGIVYLDYDTNAAEYNLSYRQWASSTTNVDSVKYHYSSSNGFKDSATYTFSKGGPPSYVASQMKWFYNTDSSVSSITESSVFTVAFYERMKYYHYSAGQMDSSTIILDNDSALASRVFYYWANGLLDSVIQQNGANKQYYKYDSSGNTTIDSLIVGQNIYVSRYFYRSNGMLDSSMYDQYQLSDTTKISCYNSITYDSLGNYDRFDLTFYNHSTQLTSFGYYDFIYAYSTIGQNELGHADEGIYVYPNPVSNILFIKSSKRVDLVQILDLSGKVVVFAEHKNAIDLACLPKGSYVVKIQCEDAVVVKQVAKL